MHSVQIVHFVLSVHSHCPLLVKTKLLHCNCAVSCTRGRSHYMLATCCINQSPPTTHPNSVCFMFWHCYTVQAASKFLKPLAQLKQEPLRNFYKETLLFIYLTQLTQTQFPTQTQGDLQQLLMAAHACELWLPAGCSCYSESWPLYHTVEVFPSLLWGRKETAIVLLHF